MIKVLYFLAPIVIVVSVIYQIVQNMGTFKNPVPIENNFSNCKYLEQYTPGPEDITRFNQTVLVFSYGDLLKLGLGNPSLAKPGGIYAIFDADKEKFDVRSVPIDLFPQHVYLTPHGIYLKEFPDGKYLYVINHAYGRGGERIECFKFQEENGQLSLDYEYSIIMPSKYLGITNDLLVLNQTNILVTVPFHYPHPVSGVKDLDFFSMFKSAVMLIFHYKKTFVHSCKFQPAQGKEVIPDCKILEQTASVFTNGITKDLNDHIWLADTVGQKVRKFNYLPDDDSVMKLVEVIETDGGFDNLDYDQFDNKIQGASMCSQSFYGELIQDVTENGGVSDHKLKTTYWSQGDQINLDPKSENYGKVETIFRSLKGNKGTSMTYQIGNNLFLGSFCDSSLMVCQKTKPREQFD